MVYVYSWDSAVSAYKEVLQLVASDAGHYDSFGSAVALDGDTLAVGAEDKDTVSDCAGKVYIYKRDSATSTYTEVAQLVAPDAAANDHFGSSIAMSGSRLVVAAGGKATVSGRVGAVYVYEWDETTSTYVEVVALVASTSGNHYEFGTSIAVDGDRLMIGALDRNIYETTIGKVYLYDLQSGNEEQ